MMIRILMLKNCCQTTNQIFWRYIIDDRLLSHFLRHKQTERTSLVLKNNTNAGVKSPSYVTKLTTDGLRNP